MLVDWGETCYMEWPPDIPESILLSLSIQCSLFPTIWNSELTQSDSLLQFSMGPNLNWFHVLHRTVDCLPECSFMVSVQMRDSYNACFVPGLFTWLLAFQCSCFDKQHQNTFFHVPMGWWVLVFSEESGVHFLCSLRPRGRSVSKFFPSVRLMLHVKRLETVA